MRVELIRQHFSHYTGYKIKKMEYCCDKLKENRIIDFTSEYDGDFPAMCLIEDVVTESWGEEWCETYYHEIEYCPFCGKPIKIEVVADENVDEEYIRLELELESLKERKQKTDSKKEEREINSRMDMINKKLDYFYELRNYEENK